MTDLSEERLAELIAILAPAPAGWVQAAIELPSARAAIDRLAARASVDQESRAAMLADLEAALRAADMEPRPQLLEILRERLSRLD